MAAVKCSWCGEPIDPEDGYRLIEAAGERRAAFCRLEHVVPWAMQGAHWDAGTVDEPAVLDASTTRCSRCEADLEPELHLLLVHHRGEHRIADGFCSVDHLLAWARAGGRWGAG